MQEFARVCEQAARAGGEVLKRMQGQITVREKAPADLVTDADLSSQRTIRRLLLDVFPNHGFLGEETLPEGASDGSESADFMWIVDPLDGTTNYVHGMDNFCVSVALRQQDQIVVGVIYDPSREECFVATQGNGAFCNGRRIHCSSISALDQALVAASLPARVAPGSAEVARFLNVMYECQAIRRLGSAALNLCHVAAGRMDGYWANSIQTWDVAAGFLMVREAGGVITRIDGEPFEIDRPRLAAAGNATLHAQLISTLAKPCQP